jgi:hypothetical protein
MVHAIVLASNGHCLGLAALSSVWSLRRFLAWRWTMRAWVATLAACL